MYKNSNNKFNTLKNENSQKICYMFTNGLGDEFALYEKWKERIFTNPNHTFAFIFSKPKNIKKGSLSFYLFFGINLVNFVKQNNYQ